MKRLLFFICLGCGTANAATMCVPDLSSCTSCTNATYSGITWSATCCGVKVEGIAIVLSGIVELVANTFKVCPAKGKFVVADRKVIDLARVVGEGYDFCATCGCVVVAPMLLNNGYEIDLSRKENIYDDYITTNCAEDCANNVSTIVQNLF